MRYRTPTIPADATPEQLRATIAELRRLQRKAVIPSTGVEIGADIDRLIERLAARVA